ncbi:MAG: thioesterase family protein [Pseudomonadota bacterium]
MQTHSWDHDNPFIHPVTVVSSDIDSFDHVNNTVYLRWLTECAWAHSAAVGLPETTCVQMRRGMAVRTINVEILASAYLHDELLVGNWLTNKTRLKATRVYQIINRNNDQTLLRGQVDFVCVDLDSGRPARMPPEFIAGYTETLAKGE